jgi:hypothetical protein
MLVGIPEGKRLLGRPRCRQVNLLKRGCTDWINLAKDRDQWRAIVNMVMNLQIP